MIELLEVAAGIQAFCQAAGWRFCFIGGLAVQHWGEIRVTRDVDLTLLTGLGEEEKFVAALLAHYQPRIEKAAEFALRHRVLLLQTPPGIGIDVALGALPFEASAVGAPVTSRSCQEHVCDFVLPRI